MVAQYQVTLTETIRKRAERLAELAGHTVEEMLPVLLMLSNPTFSHPLDFDRTITDLSDEDVLAIAALQMLPDISSRQSALLQAQGRDELSNEERMELDTLTLVYGIGLVYKAEALSEAVKRGLRESLES